jgi:hypothetical protein
VTGKKTSDGERAREARGVGTWHRIAGCADIKGFLFLLNVSVVDRWCLDPGGRRLAT